MTTGFLIYLIIIATGFVTGLVVYRKNAVLRPVTILLGVTLLSEIVSRVLAYRIHNSNPGYHFFDPIQASLWAIFFFNAIINKRIRRSIPVLTGILVAFSIINTLLLEGLYVFPDNFLKIESVVLLFWATVLFIEQIDLPSVENILVAPVFIISLGVLWFYITSFLFFQFFNSLKEYAIPMTTLRFLLYFSDYTYYLLLLLAMAFQIKRNER